MGQTTRPIALQRGDHFVGSGRHNIDAAIYSQGVGFPPDDYLCNALGTVQRNVAKECLIWEGDDADAVFKVKSGTLCIYRLMSDGRRQVSRFCRAGQYLGLTAGDVYPYNAEVVSDVELVRIRRRDFDEEVERDHVLQKFMLGQVTEELRTAQRQLVLLGRKSAIEKVASFLLEFGQPAESKSGSAHIAIPMTRVDIADHLGLTHETVCRAFAQMRKEGIISIPDPHLIEVHDLESLEDVAEGGRGERLCA